jgi:hypothetical protein
MFKRRNPLEGAKVYPVVSHLDAAANPEGGVNLTIPVKVYAGRHSCASRLVINVERDEIKQLASMTGRIRTHTPVATRNGAAKRPKFCVNNHRQISENVIHWPKGNEDCRICYLEWKVKKGLKKSQKAASA